MVHPLDVPFLPGALGNGRAMGPFVPARPAWICAAMADSLKPATVSL